ncbi:MAG: YraN family protein [Pseudomonadota bacterium]
MRDLGDQFEERAANWLLERGWQIVQRNYSTRLGELDIVALDDSTLVFVEVKARSHSHFAGAAAAVGHAKQRKLLRAAKAFLRHYPQHANRPCRFDVIAFEPRQSSADHRLNWIRSAFTA